MRKLAAGLTAAVIGLTAFAPAAHAAGPHLTISTTDIVSMRRGTTYQRHWLITNDGDVNVAVKTVAGPYSTTRFGSKQPYCKASLVNDDIYGTYTGCTAGYTIAPGQTIDFWLVNLNAGSYSTKDWVRVFDSSPTTVYVEAVDPFAVTA